MHKVCIAISTYGDRINSIAIPDCMQGICYLIVHQAAADVELSATLRLVIDRADVHYFSVDSIGLSKSRNFALLNAESDYIHIMDDDVEINASNIKKITELAAADSVDIALGYFRYRNGGTSKNGKESKKIGVRGFFSVCSIEMCIGKGALEKGIFFDEKFGLGTRNPSGEELVYLADARRKGLFIKYYPLCVGVHPDITSGDDFFSTNIKIQAKKNMLERAFPRSAFMLKAMFFIKKTPILIKSRSLFIFFRNFFF